MTRGHSGLPRLAFTLLGSAFFIAVAYKGGVFTAAWIFDKTPEMPTWLYVTIRHVLDATGNEDLRDPSDLTTLANLATIAFCWVVAGLSIAAAYFAIRRSLSTLHRRKGSK